MKTESVKIWLVAVTLFLCPCPAVALIEFKDGLTHDINYQVNDDIRVDYQTPDKHTKVNWLTGGNSTTGSLDGYEHSETNLRGGFIDEISSFDFSQVDVSGGITRLLQSMDSSQVNISGGRINWELRSYHYSQLNVSGGEIYSLYSYHSSQVDIFGGLIETYLYSNGSSKMNISGGSIRFLSSFDSSQVDISGGSIYRPYSRGSSQINIFGGSIGSRLWSSNESTMQIFGYDFAVDGQPFGYGELTSIHRDLPNYEPLRRLTGTLLSGEFINNDFQIGFNGRIILIPEPATLLLLGLGAVMLRRKY
jgi:hypothetical protein